MNEQIGAVSGGHTATVNAGKEVLLAGGNAFDAMLASLFVSFVAEPCMSSPGGGLFLLYRTADGQEGLIDGFCQTPGKKLPLSEIDFRRIPIDFGTVTEDFYAGSGSIAIPGAIAAATLLHKKFCSMPLPDLLQPAISHARQGLPIDPFQAYDFELLEAILRIDPLAAADFFANGQLRREADVLALPALADFLEEFGREGARFFYEGEIASQLIAAAGPDNQLSMADFANFKAIERSPIRLSINDWTILSNPAPSGGGSRILALLAMADIENERSSTDGMAAWLENISLASSSEPSDKQNKERALLSAAISRIEGEHIFKANGKLGKWGSTSHINTTDAAGNTVSLTSSNGEGSGIWVQGIQFNNMLGEAALFPGGFQSWQENSRISSLMSPTIAFRKDEVIALGSGGASRIPSAVGQVAKAIVSNGVQLKEAIDAPRMHWQDGQLNCELGIDVDQLSADFRSKVTQWDRLDMYFGGVHALQNSAGKMQAYGDKRRNGAAETV